ncbi:MAG: pas [uncultured bacterium]|nr:MAG: pas [uncultured bacterium]
MADMNGFDVLRKIRENTATHDIPVIFITSLHDDDSEQHGLELGAVDYVHKPLKNLTVLSRVRTQLDAKAARDMLRRNNQRLKNEVAEGACALEQAQRQLLQGEKMAAMGQLAAGIAHEINNPVSFVGSNLGTLETYLNEIFSVIAAYENGAAALGPHPAFEAAKALQQELDYDFLQRDSKALLAESKDGIKRVRQIVSDLRDFSRISENDWEWTDLHRGLDSTLNIVWNELKYHCTIEKNYGDLPPVRCLAAQLNQVFMNLLVNAAQAIERKGKITITTQPGNKGEVRIIISDTGKGIAAENLSHIFEPFYTTKPAGKGTGLGLSLSQNIIARHHGQLEASSEIGQGATFTITLPVDACLAQEESEKNED